MTAIQHVITALLPRVWSDSVRLQSTRWLLRCCSCHSSRSVWDAGGVRWLAASEGKRKLIYCPECSRLRWAALEWMPNIAEQPKASTHRAG